MGQARRVPSFATQHRAKLTVRQSGGQRNDLASVAEREMSGVALPGTSVKPGAKSTGAVAVENDGKII